MPETAANPFRHADGTITMDAASRIDAVKSFDLEQCRQALEVPGLQKAVEKRLRSKIRRINKAMAQLPENFNSMTVQQRAKALLSIGVEAKVTSDGEAGLDLGFAPHVNGMILGPCGLFDSEQEAIEAGAAWLEEKAAEDVDDLDNFPGKWEGGAA
jgi:hypothetical protein